MNLPQIGRAQLEPLLDRLLGGGLSSGPAPLVLVRGDPTATPPTLTIGGHPVDVVASASPLEIRARIAKPRSAPLVVITGCDTSTLGDDLVARSLHRKIYTVDRWHTVAQLFGAERVTRSLAENSALADALIATTPINGYPAVPSRILDLETALDALVVTYLGIRPGALASLLVWGETAEAARIVRTAPSDVLGALESHLQRQLGPGARVVFAAIRAGHGGELMSYALAAGPIHHADANFPAAAVRLEIDLSAAGIGAESFRSIGDAAAQRVRETPPDVAPVGFWLSGADQLLTEWGAERAAARSDVLPSGFTQRIAAAAEAMKQWRDDVDSTELAEAVEHAIELVAGHHQCRQEPHRLERLQMAARLIRRRSADLSQADTLTVQLTDYMRNGAWLDRARNVVSQGDPEPTMTKLCASLTEWADNARLAQGAEVAKVSAAAASRLGDGVLGVEDVLTQVVAPLAVERPVLMVVLDGLSYPIATDLIGRLRRQGWSQYIDEAGVASKSVVAALPTVTELSRTSLLSGELRSGTNQSELRAFTKHPDLVNAGTKAYPPQLFHKADFRQGGLDTIPHEILDVIHNDKYRVVGIVLNNIDERLKDVVQPPQGWGLDELAPLREALDAARQAGRVVVLTSDHGHVLERNTVKQPSAGGGERWRRVGDTPAGDGEISVAGARIVTDEKAAILPWAEKIHYGTKRNGYHGGLTLAELVIPLVVLSADDIDGWTPTDLVAPEWWHSTPTLDAVAVVAPPVTPARPKPAPVAPSLFDTPEPEPGPVVSEHTGGPIEQIVARPEIADQLAALRLDRAQVVMILNVLDAVGGTSLHEDRVADHAGVPRVRIARTITQLQRLVNIDGYPVIETNDGQIRFDRKLLERQLGL